MALNSRLIWIDFHLKIENCINLEVYAAESHGARFKYKSD